MLQFKYLLAVLTNSRVPEQARDEYLARGYGLSPAEVTSVKRLATAPAQLILDLSRTIPKPAGQQGLSPAQLSTMEAIRSQMEAEYAMFAASAIAAVGPGAAKRLRAPAQLLKQPM